LKLNNNQLSGVIPTQIGSLLDLRYFMVDYNYLHGTVPPTFSNLTQLVRFNINNNQLDADSGFNAILPPAVQSMFTTNNVNYNLSNNLYTPDTTPPTITLNG
jgi:Leucine rich repeat